MTGHEIRGADSTNGQAGGFTLVMRRNSSYAADQCGLAFGSLAAISLAIAAGFAAAGVWAVMPFAGLEVGALWVAMRHIAQRAHDYERVVVDGEHVVVELFEARLLRRVEFQRYWARLVLKQTAQQFRVAIRSHGREFELGRYLDEGGRRKLAARLQSSIAGR